MKVAEIDVAKAIIAHEAVDCFVGKEQAATKQPKKLVSAIGGAFWGKSGEEWPKSKRGKPLMPWLQIVCTEMEGLYGCFYKRQCVCFYLNEEFDGGEAKSAFDATDFVVREYQPDDKLVMLPKPGELDRHVFRQVVWKRLPDYPSLSKYHKLFEKAVYSALCSEKPFALDNRNGIKIGGWPTPIQSPQRYPGEFELQIDMTSNYRYADSGIGYISKGWNGWSLMFECC